MSRPAADPGRGEHPPLIDVERVHLDPDARIARRELRDVFPVRGRPFPVEHARRGEHEHTRADRGEARAALEGAAQRSEERRRGWLLRRAPSGNHDGVGALERTERVRHGEPDPAGRADRAALGGAHRKLVPRHRELGARQGEELHDAAELEGAEAIVGDRDHFVTHWRDLNGLWRLRHSPRRSGAITMASAVAFPEVQNHAERRQ